MKFFLSGLFGLLLLSCSSVKKEELVIIVPLEKKLEVKGVPFDNGTPNPVDIDKIKDHLASVQDKSVTGEWQQKTESYLKERSNVLSSRMVDCYVGTVDYKKYHFSIGLIDYDNNKAFNELQTDKLLVDYPTVNAIDFSFNSTRVGNLQKHTFFRVDNQFFEVSYFAPDGSEIHFIPVNPQTRLNGSPTIWIDFLLPRMTLKDPSGKELNSRSVLHKKKKTLWIIWNNQSPKGEAYIDNISAHIETLQERYHMVGLYLGGWNRKVAAYLEDKALPFDQYVLGYHEMRGLGYYSLELGGMLVRPDGFIELDNMSREEVLENIKLKTEN